MDRYGKEIACMEGFGQKSWNNLWESIQRSRNTTFERFLVAMDIPMIGSTASKTLVRVFHSSLDGFEAAVCAQYDFTQLPDFGETLHTNIHTWFQSEENWYLLARMREVLNVPPTQEPAEGMSGRKSSIDGMTIVVTGKVDPYTREGIHAFIEDKCGIVGSSVTKKRAGDYHLDARRVFQPV